MLQKALGVGDLGFDVIEGPLLRAVFKTNSGGTGAVEMKRCK